MRDCRFETEGKSCYRSCVVPPRYPEIRRLAAGLLVGCSDQAVLQQAIQGYAHEPDHEVRLELLRTARQRDLGIDRDAVRACVLDEQAISEEREVALAVLLYLDQRHPTPLTGELLAALLPASLADPAFPLGETVLGAAEQLPAGCLPVLAAHVRQFAEAPLAGSWGTNPKAAPALASCDPTLAVDLLLRALDAALHAASETSSQEVLDGLAPGQPRWRERLPAPRHSACCRTRGIAIQSAPRCRNRRKKPVIWSLTTQSWTRQGDS